MSLNMRKEYIKNLVTVIMPTYNTGQFLRDTIASVFHQNYRPIELLLIDDGSTDNTKEIVREWEGIASESKGFELRYYYQKNSGAQVARNRGLDESEGEFIQYLDSDDLIHESKVATQVDYLKKNNDCGFVYSYTSGINSEGDAITKYPISGWVLGNMVNNNLLLGGSVWHPHSGIFRRSVCEKLGYWNEKVKLWQDWEYSVRLGYVSEVIRHLPLVLSCYRIHDNPNRISQRINQAGAFDKALESMRLIKEYMERSGRQASNERCLLSVSMMRLMPLAMKSNSTANIEVVHDEVATLNPCVICKLRLRIMMVVYKAFGCKGYMILSRLAKKIVSIAHKIYCRTLRLLGGNKYRPPRISIHL